MKMLNLNLYARVTLYGICSLCHVFDINYVQWNTNVQRTHTHTRIIIIIIIIIIINKIEILLKHEPLTKIELSALYKRTQNNTRVSFDSRLLHIILARFLPVVIWLCLIFGHSFWNSLPLHTRNAVTVSTFKFTLSTHLFNLPASVQLIPA